MGHAILDILTLLGGLSLCIYGMTVMSEGILKLFGAQIRASLRTLSKHRIAGFWFGDWVTMLIQSSSAAIMMAVGFVSTGMLTISQSIALIMGANVGTTITAWVVALFGYSTPVGYLAVPLILFGMPFYFFSNVRRKPVGETLIGIALMILGFTLFIEHMPLPSDYSSLYSQFEFLSGWSFGSVLLFVVIGILFTILLQSSAATIILSMALCASGWISFYMAAALVIGDNVGTTLTPIFGSDKANVTARRASYAHLFFNLFGMVWALALLYPVADMILGLVGSTATPASLALGIAAYHTLFNLLTSFLLIGFVRQIDGLLQKLIPVNSEDDEEVHLSFIHGGILSTSELSVEEARKEAVLFGERCMRMLQLTDEFVHMSHSSDAFAHAFSRIEKYEKITDRLELEIVRYLNSVDRSSLSEHMASRVLSLYKVVDELESIGDSCYNLARVLSRKRQYCKEHFTDEQLLQISHMEDLVMMALQQMNRMLEQPEGYGHDISQSYQIENKINQLRNDLRNNNLQCVEKHEYDYRLGAFYIDYISECEKLGDHIINVVQAKARLNKN